MIGPGINIRISAKDPMKYIEKYGISDRKLCQQYIEPQITSVPREAYPTWVKGRATDLAIVANEFLTTLAPPT